MKLTKEQRERLGEAFIQLQKQSKWYILEVLNEVDRILSEDQPNPRIGFLRQWLNEDRIDDPDKIVTNKQIEAMLFPEDQPNEKDESFHYSSVCNLPCHSSKRAALELPEMIDTTDGEDGGARFKINQIIRYLKAQREQK